MRGFVSLLIVILTLLVAIVLQILPVPEQFANFRPDWLLACVFYWCIALPMRFNVLGAFVCGLVLDLLLGSTLGIRALSFSLVGYIAAINYVRIRNMSLWQQAIVFALTCIANKAVIFWINYIVHGVQMPAGYFYSAIGSLIIWPWIYLLLRKLRRRFRVEA